MIKKLLFVGSSLNYGSPGNITESIGRLAMEHGWIVYQAHGVKYANPSHLITRPVSSHIEELFHAGCSFLADRHGLASTKGTKSLVKWIEDISPDIIHLHNLHGYYLNYQILFDYLARKETPIVWTLHDFWPITGHCAHFDFVGCDKWKTQCSQCPQISTYPRSLFIDNSRSNFSRKKKAFTSVSHMIITPVSKWVGELIKDSFLGKYLIMPIYNGVDTDVFKPVHSDLREQLGLKNKFVLLGVASPWYPMKGLYDYFKLSRYLSESCQIIMIGLTRKQIDSLPQNIIGLERVQNQSELAAYYSMADVVLNLSYQETFGMTTVEGMACGTPGIVYNKTALPELVTDGTGYVIPAGDISSLLHVIDDLRRRGKSCFSESCRTRAITSFDKQQQFMKYIELYESLL